MDADVPRRWGARRVGGWRWAPLVCCVAAALLHTAFIVAPAAAAASDGDGEAASASAAAAAAADLLVTSKPVTPPSTTPSPGVDQNCTVKHCRQCDPALPDECVECVPPYLREDGSCRTTCGPGFFPVVNMTDNPVDYPRCERDCDALQVRGIPSAQAPYAAASSAVYNLLYVEEL
jgi:hypothetical protein